MKVNFKKIIKGVIGLGAVGGVAYLSYKIGESNGEANEKFRAKYGEDDDEDFDFGDDEDDEPLNNYYGTCFEPKYDEPDDLCISPAEYKNNKDKSDYVKEYEINVKSRGDNK